MDEQYYTNKRNEVREAIEAYRAEIAEIGEKLKFETDPKKHAQLKLNRMELESSIEIAQAKFNVIDREREDQLKTEQAAAYDELKSQAGRLSAEILAYENKFYKLLAETLVPDLDKFEQIFQVRGTLEREINNLARNSDGELSPISVSPTSVLGLSIPGNDMRAPSIAKTLIGSIQLHHQKYQGAIESGTTPKFKLSKELLADVGYFNVTADGEIYSESPKQQAIDRMKLEANRDLRLVKEVR